jgi:hypothetical protein
MSLFDGTSPGAPRTFGRDGHAAAAAAAEQYPTIHRRTGEDGRPDDHASSRLEGFDEPGAYPSSSSHGSSDYHSGSGGHGSSSHHSGGHHSDLRHSGSRRFGGPSSPSLRRSPSTRERGAPRRSMGISRRVPGSMRSTTAKRAFVRDKTPGPSAKAKAGASTGKKREIIRAMDKMRESARMRRLQARWGEAMASDGIYSDDPGVMIKAGMDYVKRLRDICDSIDGRLGEYVRIVNRVTSYLDRLVSSDQGIEPVDAALEIILGSDIYLGVLYVVQNHHRDDSIVNPSIGFIHAVHGACDTYRDEDEAGSFFIEHVFGRRRVAALMRSSSRGRRAPDLDKAILKQKCMVESLFCVFQRLQVNYSMSVLDFITYIAKTATGVDDEVCTAALRRYVFTETFFSRLLHCVQQCNREIESRGSDENQDVLLLLSRTSRFVRTILERSDFCSTHEILNAVVEIMVEGSKMIDMDEVVYIEYLFCLHALLHSTKGTVSPATIGSILRDVLVPRDVIARVMAKSLGGVPEIDRDITRWCTAYVALDIAHCILKIDQKVFDCGVYRAPMMWAEGHSSFIRSCVYWSHTGTSETREIVSRLARKLSYYAKTSSIMGTVYAGFDPGKPFVAEMFRRIGTGVISALPSVVMNWAVSLVYMMRNQGSAWPTEDGRRNRAAGHVFRVSMVMSGIAAKLNRTIQEHLCNFHARNQLNDDFIAYFKRYVLMTENSCRLSLAPIRETDEYSHWSTTMCNVIRAFCELELHDSLKDGLRRAGRMIYMNEPMFDIRALEVDGSDFRMPREEYVTEAKKYAFGKFLHMLE